MNPTNGYVVDDNCVFGAEVLVIKSERVNECLRLVKDAAPTKHEWKIPNFSKLGDVWESEDFDVGNYKWYLLDVITIMITCEEWGYSKFMSTADMSAKGFLVDDCCFVEIEITFQATVREEFEF
ncbi:uncharacterized protein LOC125220668 [Salvia hispanica]|uniref:uncharacterized protein LOC125220668 n=1 Tax=Salvia hispanica TaxID=49212 RepID=UPI0020091DA8|nr:uncharacterized protein LOC125220668 [Salvia hispanica]